MKIYRTTIIYFFLETSTTCPITVNNKTNVSCLSSPTALQGQSFYEAFISNIGTLCDL